MSVHQQILAILDATASPQKFSVSGLRGSSNAWFAAQLGNTRTVCLVVPNEQAVQGVSGDLQLFAKNEILAYPGYEIPPYTPLSPDQKTTAQRLSTLYHLNENERALFTVVSIEALMRRVLPKSRLTSRA